MANQPSKYSKFLLGAASAALVASAVAPVASAADFKDTKGNTHEKAIDALSDAGVISGYPDGTFLPNKTLTRSDVVKLMGKWLVSTGYSIPTDYKTNPRFTDLKSTSNDELLQYAAVVFDNGVFNGSNGRLLAADNITRENMAVVLVRAFDRVNGIDLVAHVEDQKFTKDVKDLGVAKSEARPAIDVLDFYNVTTVANFDPKGTTTRGHFATFLNNFLNADLSDVKAGAVAGAATVKAVNATTVEVAFKDAVENLNSLNFTIDGLTVSNAAVKQTDNKTVVLTTAVQKGGEKYTVSQNNEEIGTFEGVSAVIPTKVTVNTDSVQGIVGKQVILSADIGTKEAGVPVTFNIKAANNSLNKDNVAEVVTNADGIATYSYTQYNAGFSDEVAVYPTGAPQVRDFATIWWGVDTILTLEEDDKKGNKLNNGENKVYKITYKNPKTGKPVENATVNLTFVENVDVNVNQLSDATVNGVTPYQLNNGRVKEAKVETDSKGEATVTVSGTNDKATLVAFIDNSGSTATENNKLERTELQVRANEVTFGAIQSKYAIELTRDGGEEAATGLNNGRVYKVVVKDEDGKAAAGEVVNVAFDEILDNVIATKTNAVFVEDEDLKGDTSIVNGSRDQQITLKLNSKGEGEFQIATAVGNTKEYATPVVWLDINSANNKEGTLEDGEPNKVAGITYFAEEKVEGSKLKAYQLGGSEIKDNRTQDGDQVVYFNYTVANQSGETYSSSVRNFKATFQVTNTGTEDVYVWTNEADAIEGDTRKATVISTRRGETFTLPTANTNGVKLYVASKGKSATVDVKSYGQTEYQDHNGDWKTARLSESKVAKATFKASNELGTSQTGQVVDFKKDKKKITLAANGITFKELDYKEEFDARKVKYEQTVNNTAISLNFEQFERIVDTNNVELHYYKNSDGEITFTILEATEKTVPVTELTPKTVNQTITIGDDAISLTASDLATSNKGLALSLTGAATSDTATVATATVTDNKLVITPGTTAGTAEVTVSVTDGKLTTTATVKVTVEAKGETEIKLTDVNAAAVTAVIPNSTYNVVLELADVQAKFENITADSVVTLAIDGKESIVLDFRADKFYKLAVQGYSQAELENAVVTVQ